MKKEYNDKKYKLKKYEEFQISTFLTKFETM